MSLLCGALAGVVRRLFLVSAQVKLKSGTTVSRGIDITMCHQTALRCAKPATPISLTFHLLSALIEV